MSPSARRGPYGAVQREILDEIEGRRAREEIRGWPGYVPTPLLDLPELARELDVAAIRYKDESARFGLGSFKALGGAYAVYRLLAREIARRTGGREPGSAALVGGAHAGLVSEMTVTCATAGNHGRSVAWGAELFGCRCVIYLPGSARPARAAAIESHVARVVRTDSHYDDAVVRCRRDAEENGWFVVSDSSYEGYTDIPRDVMHGYTLMVAEALRQLPSGERPSHVFVQAGVGGLSTAVCGHLWQMYGAARPTFALVEPEDAACFLASARAGHRVEVGGPFATMMGGLASGEPSLLAWPVLAPCVDAYLTIGDGASASAIRRLAEGRGADPKIVAGESGAAGLAGLIAVATEPASREKLGLDPESVVLVFGTEGAIDAELHAAIVRGVV